LEVQKNRGEITMTKEWTFEDLPTVDSIDIGLNFDYYYDPGKFSGRPEDCYPPEEESNVSLPDGWEEIVMGAYVQAARKAIAQIQAEVEELAESNAAAEWAEDAAADYEEAKADAMYDDWKWEQGL
jgi:FtsZ-binding cell division protein ZapB